jgi:hypothetical protein
MPPRLTRARPRRPVPAQPCRVVGVHGGECASPYLVAELFGHPSGGGVDKVVDVGSIWPSPHRVDIRVQIAAAGRRGDEVHVVAEAVGTELIADETPVGRRLQHGDGRADLGGVRLVEMDGDRSVVQARALAAYDRVSSSIDVLDTTSITLTEASRRATAISGAPSARTASAVMASDRSASRSTVCPVWMPRVRRRWPRRVTTTRVATSVTYRVAPQPEVSAITRPSTWVVTMMSNSPRWSTTIGSSPCPRATGAGDRPGRSASCPRRPARPRRRRVPSLAYLGSDLAGRPGLVSTCLGRRWREGHPGARDPPPEASPIPDVEASVAIGAAGAAVRSTVDVRQDACRRQASTSMTCATWAT